MIADLTWATARDLAQLGELTARWLLGELDEYPAYSGKPDEETGPLAPTLAAVNRAGLVTDFSQPGFPEDDGWLQRSAVSGFCSYEVASRLVLALGPTDLVVLADLPGRDAILQIPVTLVDGEQYTWVGLPPPLDYVAQCYDGAHPQGVATLCASAFVTILDPCWGRDELLWPALLNAMTT